MNKEYLKLKLPVADVYDKEYWRQVTILNRDEFETLSKFKNLRQYGNVKEFKNINLSFYIQSNRIKFDYDSFELPYCKFNEVEKMQKYYEIAQRIIEIEKEINE